MGLCAPVLLATKVILSHSALRLKEGGDKIIVIIYYVWFTINTNKIILW